MNPLLVYIVGPPGVGKTAVMAELTAGCRRVAASKPIGHESLLNRRGLVGIELGLRREAFSGTDALAMNAQPAASAWIQTRPHDLLLAEGARLATAGFLYGVRASGYRVAIIQLTVPEEVLEARRAERGSDQDPRWMRGATTRAQRICQRMALDANVWPVSALASPTEIADQIWRFEPQLEVLKDA